MTRKKHGDGDATLIADAKLVTTAMAKFQSALPKGLAARSGSTLIAAHEKNVATAKAAEKVRAQTVRTKEASAAAVRTYVTRVRSSTRGAFGGDSDEYAAVGGVRTSARKRPKRKPKPATTTTK